MHARCITDNNYVNNEDAGIVGYTSFVRWVCVLGGGLRCEASIDLGASFVVSLVLCVCETERAVPLSSP